MKPTIIIFIFYVVTISNCDPAIPTIPCPSIFKYIYDGRTYSGLVTLPAPKPSANRFTLSTGFSIPGSIPLDPEGKLPPSVSLKPDDYQGMTDIIKYGYDIKFVVTFPRSQYLPQVTNIKYNNVEMCNGPAVKAPSAWFSLQYQYRWSGISSSQPYVPYEPAPSLNTIPPRPLHPKPHVTRPPPRQTWVQAPVTNPTEQLIFDKPTPKPIIRNKYRNDRDCGVIRTKRSLILTEDDVDKRIINGTLVPSNSHPWLAAMYDNDKFFCGGSLISSKHVLTAAHCTAQKRHITIKVKLGQRNLNNLFDRGSQDRFAIKVLEHPAYQGKAHGDMALLVLNDDVVFSPGIKPICLWNHDSNFRLIVNYIGRIMGWGVQENGQASNLPMETEVTIATKEDCKKIEILRSHVTDETFCAGSKNTGPCMGDSGGGLYLRFDNKWYLRGIISTALSYKNSDICDTNSYAIYVDTAKYMGWIVDNMEHN